MTAAITGVDNSVPVSMAVAADGHVFVVNGVSRGFAAIPGVQYLGVNAASACTAATVNSPAQYFVASIEVKDSGSNYRSPPAVTVAGVSATAELIGDEVASVTVISSATTHTAVPAVSISTAQQASNAAATASVRGYVAAVHVSPSSGYYSSSPDVTFYTAANVSANRQARGRGVITYDSLAATSGRLASVVLTDPGEYQWQGNSLSQGVAPVGATVAAGVGGTPSLVVESSAAIVSVSIGTGGSDYSAAPTVSFQSNGPNRRGDGALALASLNSTTQVSAVTLISGGNGYDGRVDVALNSQPAVAAPLIQPRLSGRYVLGIRWVGSDGTPGNLCPLVEVDCKDGASSITWGGLPTVDGSTMYRHDSLELWRSSSGQAITLYRVATFGPGAGQIWPATSTYTDSLPDFLLTDPDRSGYAELPILRADGQPNAYRFGVPPSNMSVVTIWNDRAWYAVDSSAGKTQPNTIYYSGVGEFEAIAYDPDAQEYVNQLVIESVGRDADCITGLMPMEGVLYVGQRRHIVRLTVGDDPLTTASAVTASQRGMLNDRCWDQFEGVAYIADSFGVHAFTGSGSEPLSDAISTYWSAPLIDFSKSKWFFLRVNGSERVVRFYFSPVGSASQYPTAALCYSLVTRAWWLEEYGVAVACGVRASSGGRLTELLGGTGKMYRANSGLTDDGAAIAYRLRTGDMPLNTDPKRGLRITYSPTSGAQDLNMRVYYNNATSPRVNAIAFDRGNGFVTDTGSTQATLNMAATRSPLGVATGFAQVSFSGRVDDASAGADRTMAIELAGTGAVTIHGAQVEGVG